MPQLIQAHISADRDGADANDRPIIEGFVEDMQRRDKIFEVAVVYRPKLTPIQVDFFMKKLAKSPSLSVHLHTFSHLAFMDIKRSLIMTVSVQQSSLS